jgi:serine phosphatase RsbU (regulator of sigma subunit)
MIASDARKRKPPSLIWYLIGFIALIIGIVVAATLTISFLEARDKVEQDFAILRNNTENNAVESVWLVNRGLGLVDEDLNPLLEQSLLVFRDAYTAAGSDPARLDLTRVRDTIAPSYEGTVNLYVISADGIIAYSTLPDVLGVDFRQFPYFYDSLTRIRRGDTFAADPVVRSIQNISDVGVRGILRKFAYMPTPDHQYVLEIGVESAEFEDVRSRLSYQEMVRRIAAINPDLLGIRVYDFNGNVAAQEGQTDISGPEYAGMAIMNRTGFTVPDTVNRTLTRYLFVDLRDPDAASDASVVLEMRYSNARLDAVLAGLMAQYLLIGICAVGMGVVLAYTAFRKLTGAITAIVADVGQVAGGDLSHTIRSVNTAEFAELETGINTMIRKIMAYTEELERKKAELQVAADIQSAFLPKDIPRMAGFDLAAASVPAREVGGDFYDVFPVSDRRYTLVIADVAGKGVPASLLMALSRTAMRIVSRWEKIPERVLEESNAIFIRDSGSTSFVTVFYAILDTGKRQLTYVNAGHNPPMLFRADGTYEELEPTGPVIGLREGTVYEERSVAMDHGDILVMYTDGVTEAIDAAEEMFSEERLRETVLRNRSLPAAELIGAINAAVREFCGETPQFDDMTLMVLRAE